MGINQGVCFKCKGSHTGNHCSYCIPCYRAFKRESYLRNTEAAAERQKRRARENPESIRMAQLRKRLKKIAYYRDYNREYKRRNRDRVQIWDQRKKAKRKFGQRDDLLTSDQWEEILIEHAGRCFYCGCAGKMTVDHYIPLSRGGSHSRNNIKPACKPCNGSKGAKMPDEFEEYRRLKLDALKSKSAFTVGGD